MSKSHLELRRADALEHDEIMKFRKKLISDRIVTIICFVLLDAAFIVGTIGCLMYKQYKRSILPIIATLGLLFLTVIVIKDHEHKIKEIRNKNYMVSEGTVVKKSTGGSFKHPKSFLTVENKDGSKGKYKVIPSVYGKAEEGSPCLIIKYDKEEIIQKKFTRDVVICERKTD